MTAKTDEGRAFDLIDAGLTVPELSRLILELGITCRFVDGQGRIEMTEAQLMALATELVWKGRERQATIQANHSAYPDTPNE